MSRIKLAVSTLCCHSPCGREGQSISKRTSCSLATNAWLTAFVDQGDDERSECHLAKADEICAQAGVDRDSLAALPFLR